MNAETKADIAIAEAAPRAGLAAVPIWLVMVMALLGYRGCMYVDEFGGGFDSRVYTPYASFKQLDDLQPKSGDDDFYRKGKLVYTMNCAPCHQVSGEGAPGVAPPLIGSEWVSAEGPNRMIRVVLNGLQGPVKVKGADYNLAMVPWKDSMNDEQIAAALTYVRRSKEWAHNASAVTPAQVSAIRKATAEKAAAWTADELNAVPVKD